MRKLNRQLRKGLAAAEFAIALPFLVFVFLATVDFARVLYFAITVDGCARNGAIFASQVYDNQNQQWLGPGQHWQGPTGEVTEATGATTLDGSNLSPPLTDVTIPGDGTVTVSYTFHTISQFPGIPSTLTITRTLQAPVAPAVPTP